MHKFRLFLLISSFLWAQTVLAQYRAAGARASAMGNVSVTFIDAQGLFSNQAGLSHLASISVAAFAEQRFMLSELRQIGLGAAIPTKSGTFGVVAQQFGFEDFKQQKIGLAYSRRFLENLTVGAQFDYLGTRISEYGSKGVLTFEIGLLIQISSQLSVGTHVFSPAKVILTKDERLPAVYRAGIAYTPSKKALVVFEMEKDVDFPVVAKAGFEYHAAELLKIRAGVSSAANTASFGLGIKVLNGLELDIAGSYHQTLGFTPVVGFSYTDLRRK